MRRREHGGQTCLLSTSRTVSKAVREWYRTIDNICVVGVGMGKAEFCLPISMDYSSRPFRSSQVYRPLPLVGAEAADIFTHGTHTRQHVPRSAKKRCKNQVFCPSWMKDSPNQPCSESRQTKGRNAAECWTQILVLMGMERVNPLKKILKNDVSVVWRNFVLIEMVSQWLQAWYTVIRVRNVTMSNRTSKLVMPELSLRIFCYIYMM